MSSSKSVVVSKVLAIPAPIVAAGDRAAFRFFEFFTSQIRNPNTRRAYARDVGDFLAWLDQASVASILDVKSPHVAAYVEHLGRSQAATSVKRRLAAIRSVFDWLATGGVLPFNPATAVRGPKHSAKSGKTPVLSPAEARQLIDSIDTSTPVGLRDRALISLMVYSLARVGAALGMKGEDVYTQDRRLWVRLHEKGGKRHEMPCHHNLEAYLVAYVEGCGLAADKAPLFRTFRGAGPGQGWRLTDTPMLQSDAHDMIRRRAAAAGIKTKIGNHTFRATGITAYLKNGGTLERAAAMANHASTRTTQLYDRRHNDLSLDDVNKIAI